MFVKEPANSLKVNSNGIGTKSWVQLKINIPVNGLSSKKIKIDIRELPYWKPASTLSSKLKKPKSRDIRESVSYREKNEVNEDIAPKTMEER